MSKTEKRVLSFLAYYRLVIFVIIATLFAFVTRKSLLVYTPVTSYFPIERQDPVDTILFSFFSKGMSWKFLLIAADFMQAVIAGLICYRIHPIKQNAVIAYVIFIFSPVILFCSDILCGAWSIAGCFTLLSVYSMIRSEENGFLAWSIICALSLGFSFFFRWQTVFFLPFFLFFAISHKKTHFLTIICSFCIYLFSCFAAGIMPVRRVIDYFIYAKEKGLLTLGFPNFWTFNSNAYPDIAKAGFGLSILSLIVIMYLVLEKPSKMNHPFALYSVSTYTILAITTFLPALDHRDVFFPLLLFLLASCIEHRLFFFSLPLEFGWLFQLCLRTWVSNPMLNIVPYLLSLGVLFTLPVYIYIRLHKIEEDIQTPSISFPFIFQSITSHRSILLILAAFLLGILIRYSGRSVISRDFNIFLYNWYGEIKVNGIQTQVGDYSVLYQLVLFILSKLPLSDRDAIKLFSSFFDLLLSVSIGAICLSTTRKRQSFALGFAITFCMPTVFLNSAYWAQCDSIYTLFAIWCVAKLISLDCSSHKNKDLILAMISLGFSFAFKLQAIFVLPFIVYLYSSNKSNFTIFSLLIPLVINMIIPVICGRSPFDSFQIYAQQTTENPMMHMNFMNIWSGLSDPEISYDLFHTYAVCLAFTILGLGLIYVLHYPQSLSGNLNRWKVFIWTVMTAVMFLPSIHDRYGYIINVALLILSISDFRFFPLFATVECCTFLLYVGFLWEIVDYVYFAFIPAYFIYTVILYLTLKESVPSDSIKSCYKYGI